MRKLEQREVPEVLKRLVEKWIEKGEEFHLSWERCCTYKGKKIKFLYENDELKNPLWYVRYGNPDEEKELNREQIQDIAMTLVKSYDTKRWSLIVDWHCNYECIMCPFHGIGTENGKSMLRGQCEPVMSKDAAYEIIDKLYEKGIEVVTLMSKGEIFLYKHWLDVSKYIAQKGMRIWTITNGSLVTDELCKTLKELNYSDVRVSLDAYSFETYSKIRSKNKTYFENAQKAPLLLKKYGITTNVHFVKQKENEQEADLFLEYWKKQNIDSISIANELVFGDEVCYNRFIDPKEKEEYIHGMCSAWGNFQTMQNGSTRFCCGTANFSDEKFDNRFGRLCLPEKEIGDIISYANTQMAIDDSQLAEVCKKCGLYVSCTTITEVGDWTVSKNTERETWIRK